MDCDSSHIGITILGSGSKGNATIIHKGNDAIMIDAGFSRTEFFRRLKQTDLPQDLRIHAILITHEHSDHVAGLRLTAQALNAQIFATTQCANYLKYHKHIEGRFNLIAPGSPFNILNFSIMPFSIPHDAIDPVAYTISYEDKKIGVATDLGIANNLVSYQLKNCDALVIESNHDPNMLAASTRPWPLKQRILGNRGHLSNEATTKLLEQIASQKLHKLVLAHISQECNTNDMAFNVVKSCLQRLNRPDISVSVATQNQPMQTFWI